VGAKASSDRDLSRSKALKHEAHEDHEGCEPARACGGRPPGEARASREAQIPFLLFVFVSFVRFVFQYPFPSRRNSSPLH